MGKTSKWESRAGIMIIQNAYGYWGIQAVIDCCDWLKRDHLRIKQLDIEIFNCSYQEILTFSASFQSISSGIANFIVLMPV